jgi:hypothetical protein
MKNATPTAEHIATKPPITPPTIAPVGEDFLVGAVSDMSGFPGKYLRVPDEALWIRAYLDQQFGELE